MDSLDSAMFPVQPATPGGEKEELQHILDGEISTAETSSDKIGN